MLYGSLSVSLHFGPMCLAHTLQEPFATRPIISRVVCYRDASGERVMYSGIFSLVGEADGEEQIREKFGVLGKGGL